MIVIFYVLFFIHIFSLGKYLLTSTSRWMMFLFESLYVLWCSMRRGTYNEDWKPAALKMSKSANIVWVVPVDHKNPLKYKKKHQS